MRKCFDSLQAPRKRNLLIQNSVIVYNSPRVWSDDAIPATENGRPILPTVFRLWVEWCVVGAAILYGGSFFTAKHSNLLFLPDSVSLVYRPPSYIQCRYEAHLCGYSPRIVATATGTFLERNVFFMKMTKMNIIKGTQEESLEAPLN